MFKLLPKLERWWLIFFLLLIPTQLGKFFWPEWSQVMGIRMDYLAPVLYLMDLMWLGLVIIQLLINNYKLSPKGTSVGARIKNLINFQNLLIVLFVVVNILIAQNKEVAIYKWLRIGQWWWFYNYCKENKLLVKEMLLKVLPWWIGIESMLGLAQVIKGGSLQGIWYWLGERRYDYTTIGVAQFSVWGEGLVRAYGTFSHPNSLAGFLLVAVGVWVRQRKLRITNPPAGRAGYQSRIIFWVVVWTGIMGIILTGSRTVWGILGLLILGVLFKNKVNIKKKIGYLLVGSGVLLMVLSVINVNYQLADFVGGWDRESITKRMNLNVSAINMWKDNLTLGVGAGNFIVRLPEYQVNNSNWLQPVHNMFLLIGTEIGCLGILIIGWKLRIKKFGILLFLITATGLMDHYWITLPQNVWLLAIVLAIY